MDNMNKNKKNIKQKRRREKQQNLSPLSCTIKSAVGNFNCEVKTTRNFLRRFLSHIFKYFIPTRQPNTTKEALHKNQGFPMNPNTQKSNKDQSKPNLTSKDQYVFTY